MKLVIEIDDCEYEEIKEDTKTFRSNGEFVPYLYKVIESGRPLSKGHGDLIAKDLVIDFVEFYQMNPQHFSFVNLIDDIKNEEPIIEADKE